MTTPPQSDRAEGGINDLAAMLLGGDPAPTSDAQSSGGDEFSLLQDLLVKPDIQQMRQQLAQLEQSFPELEARLANLEGNEEAIGTLTRIAALEAKFTALAAQFPELTALQAQFPSPSPNPTNQQATFALIKVLMPVIAAMLDRKLAALEARLLARLSSQFSSQTIPPSLSIRLSAVEPETAPD